LQIHTAGWNVNAVQKLRRTKIMAHCSAAFTLYINVTIIANSCIRVATAALVLPTLQYEFTSTLLLLLLFLTCDIHSV
jgi:hypothetical protein